MKIDMLVKQIINGKEMICNGLPPALFSTAIMVDGRMRVQLHLKLIVSG